MFCLALELCKCQAPPGAVFFGRGAVGEGHAAEAQAVRQSRPDGTEISGGKTAHRTRSPGNDSMVVRAIGIPTVPEFHMPLTRDDFAKPIEELIAGSREKAIATLVGVVASGYGGPIPGAVASGVVARFASLAIDTATSRFMAAGREWDTQQERAHALSEYFLQEVAPQFGALNQLLALQDAALAERIQDLAQQNDDNFLRLVHVMHRSFPSLDGQQLQTAQLGEILATVRTLAAQESAPSLPLDDGDSPASPSLLDLLEAQSDEWYRAEAPHTDFVYYSGSVIQKLSFGDVVRISNADRSAMSNRHLSACLAEGVIRLVSPPPWSIPGVVRYVNCVNEFPRLVVWPRAGQVPRALSYGDAIDLTGEDFMVPENVAIRRLCSEGRFALAMDHVPSEPRLRPSVYAGYAGGVPLDLKTRKELDAPTHSRQLIKSGKRGAIASADQSLVEQVLHITQTNVDPGGWAVGTYASLVDVMSRSVTLKEAKELVDCLAARGAFAERRIYDNVFAVRLSVQDLDPAIQRAVQSYRGGPLRMAAPPWNFLLSLSALQERETSKSPA